MLEAAAREGMSDQGPRDLTFALVEIIEALSAARTVEDVAAIVRTRARVLSGADGVTFVMRDGDECAYLDEDAVAPLWKGLRFPMSACISGWAMLNGRTAVVPDIYADPRIPHDAYRPTFVRSLVMTPVRPQDPLAAIGAYWAEQRQPTAEEVTALEVIARATATALANVQAYATLSENLERRKLLISELDHRCKNTLAAVQSIADQTLRRASSPAHFVEAFNGRIGALARAHELLTQGDWGHAGLADVVGQALTPFCGVGGLRIAVSGPEIGLAPETAVAMHMTVHELAVNAMKYGALSVEGGRLDVTWDIDRREEPGALELRWIERGGPVVAPPDRRGFGSRLIEQGMARELGGEAQIVFDPEGVQVLLRAPLSARLALA
ncbi:histidine kinase [Phenylobacterium sp. Root77]|nr:histidine kinase [Phenylobacterium sp. Root1277]KQW90899.1 histidine kinase [Phenylobacterium sp. Root1290]KRC39470.1 histidine kinase [Phenylobacterium sp. Root77]